MKDAIHHLKHIQKKVVQSARREEALQSEAKERSLELNGGLTKGATASSREAGLRMQRATPRLSVR